MKIEQIYTGCLAQGAYYIVSGNEAAIIDPLREVSPYINRANKDGVTIKYIFETHFHADFVSGHVDLAAQTGAQIVFGPTDAAIGYDALIAKDGQVFEIGTIKIKLIHTPGHTLESSCYLLLDENGTEKALFTGDTLFIGDVGRPDLAQKVSDDLTKEKLAGMLFESLRNKIAPLPDDIIVYPAHGAGSACGKNMSKETSDTLGHQKITNYALNMALSQKEFVEQVTDGLTAPPQYFPQNVQMNIEGYDNITEVIERGTQALSPEAFEEAANHTGAVILDTRKADEFSKAFVPNSINIGIDGSFAVWVGTLIPDVKQELLIIAEDGREEEVVTRLARVGYDYSIGYLKGGLKPGRLRVKSWTI
ncbi:MBL fold metallo-hydrolase [Niabella hibiscisoli]|uniref:MBL fold metallo-hydrolase n=1 Tax=Niabella hibiscisoli TaxID=1825928 RepID=UPI00293E808F|nr:MBL fold metallo-hydrolase [Niabella hibiscisoli]